MPAASERDVENDIVLALRCGDRKLQLPPARHVEAHALATFALVTASPDGVFTVSTQECISFWVNVPASGSIATTYVPFAVFLDRARSRSAGGVIMNCIAAPTATATIATIPAAIQSLVFDVISLSVSDP
jgi:hypothetical protein